MLECRHNAHICRNVLYSAETSILTKIKTHISDRKRYEIVPRTIDCYIMNNLRYALCKKKKKNATTNVRVLTIFYQKKRNKKKSPLLPDSKPGRSVQLDVSHKFKSYTGRPVIHGRMSRKT